MDQSYGTPILLETLTSSKESNITRQKNKCQLGVLVQSAVVEGLVPATDPHTFIKPNRPKRKIRSIKFTDCVAQNIIDRRHTC